MLPTIELDLQVIDVPGLNLCVHRLAWEIVQLKSRKQHLSTVVTC